MRCNQEQFDAIRPKLERAGLEIKDITSFDEYYYYLTNNLGNKLGVVSNIYNGAKPEYGRTIFEEWNEQTFLEYCGIESFVLPEKWCVEITESNREVLLDWVRKQRYYNNYGEHHFYPGNTVVSEHPFDDTYLYAYSPSDFLKAHPKYKQITFELFCEHVLNQRIKPMKKYKNYTVPATDVLNIRAIACNTWKQTFTTYLQRIDSDNNVSFSEDEIDSMFKAATREQRPVLVEVFGEPAKAIEWDRIRTGSKVMIQYTGQHCLGIDTIYLSEPVDVVFYKTPHCINNQGVFYTEASHSSYCTFHQNGKYVLFAADQNVDYITEVVEY